MFSVAARSIISKTPNLFRGNCIVGLAKMSSEAQKFETLKVTEPQKFIFHVELNRPDNLNAMNSKMWGEIGQCFQDLDENEECRVVILSATGKLFTAGLDFKDAMQIGTELAEKEDVARKAKILLKKIKNFQNSYSSLEHCKKPVLAAVHGACVGAGVDLITAADMRYCTKDAWFQVKEVDIGMAADVGTLQRLPKVLGSSSLARELCFTGRKMAAPEALSSGLVSQVYEDKNSMINGIMEIAQIIASKSPVAIQGTKVSMVYGRDHTVQEGLDQIATWNQLMLQSEDFIHATVGQATKQPNIVFSKL